MANLSGSDCSSKYITLNRVIASSLGGMLTSLIMTPLDVVKIRMQSESRNLASRKCFIYCNGLMDHLCACLNSESISNSHWQYNRPVNFQTSLVGLSPCHNANGIDFCIYHSGLRALPSTPIGSCFSGRLSSYEAFSKIIKTEGIFSLWSGLSPTLVMALPQTIIYYTINDWMKDKCNYRHKATTLHSTDKFNSINPTDFIPAVVGSISRIVAVVAISPLELIRTKLQSKRLSFKNISDILRSTVKEKGCQSLWTGLCPTLLRDVPYSAIFWFVYDYNRNASLRFTVSVHTGDGKIASSTPNFPSSFMLGAVAGFVAGLVTHPFDVIKTHRQIELGESIFGKSTYPASTITAMRQLYAQQGFQSLYSGFTPRLLKTTIASALMVSLFELLKERLSS